MKLDLEKIKKMISETTDEVARGNLVVLLRAYTDTRAAYSQDHTSARLRDWRAAEAALAAQIGAMDDSEPAEAALSSLVAVVDYLAGQGWKIKKSAAYQHRKEGKIKPGKNGKYTIREAEKYARTFLKRHDVSGLQSEDAQEKLQSERIKADTKKAIAQAEHWELRNKIASGLYVEKGLFERELARRLAVLKNDVFSSIYSGAPGIINVVNGNIEKVSDLIEYMLIWAMGWLRRYGEIDGFRLPDTPPVATVESDGETMDETMDDNEMEEDDDGR